MTPRLISSKALDNRYKCVLNQVAQHRCNFRWSVYTSIIINTATQSTQRQQCQYGRQSINNVNMDRNLSTISIWTAIYQQCQYGPQSINNVNMDRNLSTMSMWTAIYQQPSATVERFQYHNETNGTVACISCNGKKGKFIPRQYVLGKPWRVKMASA